MTSPPPSLIRSLLRVVTDRDKLHVTSCIPAAAAAAAERLLRALDVFKSALQDTFSLPGVSCGLRSDTNDLLF